MRIATRECTSSAASREAHVTMEIYTEAPSEATRDALRKLSDWLA